MTTEARWKNEKIDAPFNKWTGWSAEGDGVPFDVEDVLIELILTLPPPEGWDGDRAIKVTVERESGHKSQYRLLP